MNDSDQELQDWEIINEASCSMEVPQTVFRVEKQDVVSDIKLWYRGRISGGDLVVSAGLHVADAAVVQGSSTTGAAIGGGIAGPVGAFVGGVLGSVIASFISIPMSQSFSQWISGQILNKSPSEALRIAYETLGIRCAASHSEVKAQFLKLCREYHPKSSDGNEDLYNRVHVAMSLIEAGRECEPS